MKRINLILIISILLLTFVSCGQKLDSAKLNVSYYAWASEYLDENTSPHPIEETRIVSVGDTWDFDAYSLTVRIISITDQEIVITTNAPMCKPHDDGKIDLNTNETRFTIKKDGNLQLETPTMDGGYKFSFQYDIENS